MKMNFKAISAAVALCAAASAQATPVSPLTQGGSSLVIAAWNTTTQSYYVRDTGITLSAFMPSSITTGTSDGLVAGSSTTGTRTPEAGLHLDKTNTASFSDSAFSGWLSGQTSGAISWAILGSDSTALAGTSNVSRLLLSSNQTTLGPLVTNVTVTNNANALNAYATGGSQTFAGLSSTGPTVLAPVAGNLINQPLQAGTLGVDSNLFYVTRSTGQLANSTPAISTRFGNSANFATVRLDTNGDFTYDLAAANVSAVPVPAAAWLLGSGLIGLGGAARRRKAAAAKA